ncbi:JmjC domain-containing protein [Trichophyton tonsurans CBS 112818]|uniref:JmjC domain-containing protein n=1 Tax=Trichophyton tonsurans (strain CBS 112818) TaxID=647933 RepID=F2S717_TRIT1|nr:JmjC domain-containing protein [Trichophyton tonsurans CBS 112818]
MKSYTTGCELGDRAEQPVEEKLEDEDEVEGDGDDAIPVHPLGVKPSGNALAADGDIRPAMGVFGLLPDELVLTVLESFDASTLRRLGMTCRALYAFTRAEELWKALFIQASPSSFSWQGDWHSTYLNLSQSKAASPDCSQLFSDTLHRPFQCAHLSLSACYDIPARNKIPRLANMTQAEFDQSWADKPFILTEPVKQWLAFQSWSVQHILETYPDTLFRAEAVDWPFRTYVDYMNNNSDESPLYLFDKNFVSKMGLPTGAEEAVFQPPSCFGTDLFAVLGNQRPDKEWLIIGPARSGSTFHKDPNATSAWNAVLRGSKYWIMFPGSASLPPPPGVYVSADQSEVTSPLSIAEWLLNFHEEARNTPGCLEGICGEGEVLHVPSGWWHLVVNLSESIAITQNFVPRKHLRSTLDFMKNKADQVSGFRRDIEDPYGLFVERMQASYPDMLEQALLELETKKKRKWDEVVKPTNDSTADSAAGGGGFSFGFGDDSDAEVP